MSANGSVILNIHLQNEFLEDCTTCCTIIAAKSTLFPPNSSVQSLYAVVGILGLAHISMIPIEKKKK